MDKNIDAGHFLFSCMKEISDFVKMKAEYGQEIEVINNTINIYKEI